MVFRTALTASVALFIIAPASLAGVMRHDGDATWHENPPAGWQIGLKNKTAKVQISSGGGWLDYGSSVFIEDNWLITAGHVASGLTASNSRFRWPGNGGEIFSLTNVFIPTDYLNDPVNNRHLDYALVRLDGSNSSGNKTNLTSNSAVGKSAFISGYGIGGTGLTGYDLTTSTRYRAGRNRVDEEYGPNNGLYSFDFDNPLNPLDSQSGSSTPVTREFAIAPGDSGGAMFVLEDGFYRLAGIHSGSKPANELVDGVIDSDYGDELVSVRLDHHKQSIEDLVDFVESAYSTSSPIGSIGGFTTNPTQSISGYDYLYTNNIPEPSSLALIALGGFAMLRCRR